MALNSTRLGVSVGQCCISSVIQIICCSSYICQIINRAICSIDKTLDLAFDRVSITRCLCSIRWVSSCYWYCCGGLQLCLLSFCFFDHCIIVDRLESIVRSLSSYQRGLLFCGSREKQCCIQIWLCLIVCSFNDGVLGLEIWELGIESAFRGACGIGSCWSTSSFGICSASLSCRVAQVSLQSSQVILSLSGIKSSLS